MAKQQEPKPVPKKFSTIEEIEVGIRKIERRLSDLRDLDPANTKHDDPRIDRIESDIRNSILEVFGPDSPEYDEHKYFTINQGPFAINQPEYETQSNFQRGLPYAMEILSGLVRRLNEKKEDFQSLSHRPGTPNFAANLKKVFIVHGRDDELKETVARFLEKLDLEAIILSEKPSQGQTVMEKFETHSDVKAAIILLSPDDIGCLNEHYKATSTNLKMRARQNTILELGYFVGKLGRKNVIPLKRGEIELPSDIHGIIYVSFDESEGWKLKLAKELKGAGLTVDMNKI